jgi:hypothetical protein
LAPGLVLACEHVRDLDSELKVSGRPCRILDHGFVENKDKGIDLLLIAVEGLPNLPRLEFSLEYDVLDPVFWHGGQIEKRKPVWLAGYIMYFDEECVAFQGGAISSSSGSVLWHAVSGKPIGVVFEGKKKDGVPIGYAIPAAQIRKYLRAAFHRMKFTGNLKLPFGA